MAEVDWMIVTAWYYSFYTILCAREIQKTPYMVELTELWLGRMITNKSQWKGDRENSGHSAELNTRDVFTKTPNFYRNRIGRRIKIGWQNWHLSMFHLNVIRVNSHRVHLGQAHQSLPAVLWIPRISKSIVNNGNRTEWSPIGRHQNLFTIIVMIKMITLT